MSHDPADRYPPPRRLVCSSCGLHTNELRAAERLADEVAVLVEIGHLDERHPAADALLDYRDPPSSERSRALAETARTTDVYVRKGRSG